MLFKLLLIFFAYLPFQIALSPSAGVDLASARVFILVLFFVFLAESFRKKRLFIQSSRANFFLLSFLFLSFFSLFFAQNEMWSLRKFLFLLSIAPLYFVISNVVDTREKMEKVLNAMLWGGFFVAILGIAQFTFQFIFTLDATYQFWAKNVSPFFLGQNVTAAVLRNPSWLVNVSGVTYLRAIATFPDPHMLSFFLGMLVPFSLGFFLRFKKKAYLIMFFVLLLSDLLTFSRGGYLGLFSGALVAFLLLIVKFRTGYKIKTTIIVAFLSVLLVSFGPISQRFFSSFNLKEGSNRGRIETWQKAVEIISKKPVFGVGIGNYPLEVSATAGYRDPIYAHSNYLDIAAETGLLSLLAWLGFTLSLFFVFLKRADNILFFCALISVVIFSVHSLVETSLYSPVVLPLFLGIAGLNCLAAQQDEKNN
jgi:O-antigen ligase